MDISKMSDEQKSVMLARAAEWDVWEIDPEVGTGTLFVPDGQDADEIAIYDLYDPDLMRFAWQMLNWATANKSLGEFHAFWGDVVTEPMWFIIGQYFNSVTITNKLPADAQRLWLDKILTLVLKQELLRRSDE